MKRRWPYMLVAAGILVGVAIWQEWPYGPPSWTAAPAHRILGCGGVIDLNRSNVSFPIAVPRGSGLQCGDQVVLCSEENRCLLALVFGYCSTCGEREIRAGQETIKLLGRSRGLSLERAQ
ncbi:MAG: hypothetical protein ACE5I2_07390 [Anaerolineae bacterium]